MKLVTFLWCLYHITTSITYVSSVFVHTYEPVPVHELFILDRDVPLEDLKVKKEEVIFLLRTRTLKTKFTLANDVKNRKILFRKEKQFKIYIHGYLGTVNDTRVFLLTTEYLRKDDYNVILVDWSHLSQNSYVAALYSARNIAEYVAELVLSLNKFYKVPLEDIHLIGHSLGSHICGIAGKIVQFKAKEKLARITGLDPTGVLLTASDEKYKLTKNDAVFVDVIHTDGLLLGYINLKGTATFYPNGGVNPQPGCIFYRAEYYFGCSHMRVVNLFVESINSLQFVAKKCINAANYSQGLCSTNKRAIMGENIDTKLKGEYYLTTNDMYPFARGEQ